MELIEKVGPYAGIIAFLGTAILALLYFSQARDVRRIREWAGRAPERAAEAVEAYTPQKVERRRRSRYRRLRLPKDPRYVALIVGGLLVFGAAGAAAVLVLVGEEPQKATKSKDSKSSKKTARVEPSQVSVAVLNGTSVPGLATKVGEDLKAVGFEIGTVTNASRRGLSKTSVLYKKGQKPKAQAVARQLRAGSPRPVDPDDAALAPNADVVVTVGADRAPAEGASTGASQGTATAAQPAGATQQ